MKMTRATYEALSDAVLPIMRKVAHMPLNERLRWDCLFASKFPIERLYNEGLDDNHVDTALRAIAKCAK